MCARARGTLIVVLLLATLAGCGDSGGTATVAPTPNGAAPESAAPQIQVIALDSLPGVDDHVTTRGDHPIEVARPKGWYPLPATSDRLYATRLREDQTYPLIYVTAEDYAGLQDLSSGNVWQFAETMRKEAGNATKGPAPVQIGEFLGVSFADKVRAGGERVERLMLVTVHGGRKITVELRARLGTLADFAPQAQAVAGNIRFAPGVENQPAPDEAPPTDGSKPPP